DLRTRRRRRRTGKRKWARSRGKSSQAPLFRWDEGKVEEEADAETQEEATKDEAEIQVVCVHEEDSHALLTNASHVVRGVLMEFCLVAL
ncbi:unnamed protein product, partial [Musa hybrid cultivar]